MGITFNVYGDTAGAERIFPFDMIPRIIAAQEWEWIERGLRQRVHALNEFIHDIYHDQKILKDGVIPKRSHFFGQFIPAAVRRTRSAMQGLVPYCGHRPGARSDGQLYVLEDNLRVPSGVSYVLENREVLKRTFPRVFEGLSVRPVHGYPGRLLEMLESIAPPSMHTPRVVLLTPGIYNSAYFEHSFLAQQMGVQLVEGATWSSVAATCTCALPRDWNAWTLFIAVWMMISWIRKHSGQIPCWVCPALMAAYRAGRVALANAPGNGVADDKVIYAYVPDMIRYYEGEEAILPNVPTYPLLPTDTGARARAGQPGEARSEGSQRSRRLWDAGRVRIPRDSSARSSPAKIKAQSTQLYCAADAITVDGFPTIIDDHFEGRHVDLPPLCSLRQGDLCAAGRPDARRVAPGFAGGQLLARRRQQGHLGDRRSRTGGWTQGAVQQ